MAARIERLKRNQIEEIVYKKQYSFNEYYFHNIDTEEKAYWLGFLFADGYNNERRYTVEFTLKESDIDTVIKLRDTLGSKKKLEKKTTTLKNGKTYSCYSIKFCGRLFSRKLAELGCFQRKSLKLKFPDKGIIPDDLMRHFIRGYFDGDGCFSHILDKRTNRFDYSIIISSTYDFLIHLGNILNKLNVKWNIYKKVNIYDLKIRCNNCKKFLDYIYKDCSIYLSRKYDKYVHYYMYYLNKLKNDYSMDYQIYKYIKSN